MIYKPEIDGLRSVAVLSVLVFHLGSPYITGGFTGVDIFFVISGYLITDIINRGMQDNNFSIVNFYRRRALRILPPLMVVLLAVTTAASLVFLPEEIKDYGKSVLWTALFSSNIFFFKEINYFNPEAKFNPLLHTWSLAVEEQFYIVVPILFYICYRFFRPHVKIIFVASVLISFILSVALIFISQKATFYLLPTRYWEMGLGSIIALYGLHQKFTGKAADAVSVVGVMFLLASLFMLTESVPFPGPAAILPTVGACCIIIAGRNGIAGRWLSRPTPVFIGKISYSLYLWHWPLIVFYRLLYAPEITFLPGLLIALVALLLAFASYHIVETPLRRTPARIGNFRVLGSAAVSLAVLIGVGVLLQKFSNKINDYPPEVMRLAAFNEYDKTPEAERQYRKDQCFITSGTSGGSNAFKRDICLAAKPDGKPRYLLIGDSQAAHLWGALQSARDDIDLMQATASGCKPTIETEGERRCVNLMTSVLGDFITPQTVDTVVFSARWQQDDLPGLQKTIEELRGRGISKIVVLGPTVEYSQSAPLILARIAWGRAGKLSDYRIEQRNELDETMRAFADKNKVEYISLYKTVCPNNNCIDAVNGVPVQSDYGHFTDVGSKLVAGIIAGRL
ncbi:acyltransferase family protein [uncultured Agrobacterium sp.]|uniref:acyltransferase family protein n=1 Tax=uncultured Agrobacterium sp. TaxID=157277 RepID=UPI0025DF35C5|nr:acyltransferase family protein [uncultured Agrobacterium sp.]